MPAAVKRQHDLLRVTVVEQLALNLADRQGEQGSAVLQAAQGPLAGQVEHAEQVTLRAVDRH
ncbi:hypothetical protein D3C77_765220 [compost metagenome]